MKINFFRYASLCLMVLVVSSVATNNVNISRFSTHFAEEGKICIRVNDSRCSLITVTKYGSTANSNFYWTDNNDMIIVPATYGSGTYIINWCYGELTNLVPIHSAVVEVPECGTLPFVGKSYYSNELVPLPIEYYEKMNCLEVADKVYDYIYNNISYLAYTQTKRPSATEILERQQGNCLDMAYLMTDYLRNKGIEVRLVMGYVGNSTAYHAWCEVRANNSWRIYDVVNERRGTVSEGTRKIDKLY